jgi:predicted ester cyclase
MSKEIRTTIRKHMAEMNKGNVDELKELLSPDIVRHTPPLPDIKGREAAIQSIRDLQTAYPDRHQVIEEIIIEGDTSAVRYTFRGTNTGPLLPLSPTPTGKQVMLQACWVARWKEDRIVEDWVWMDMLGMILQLGMMPSQ